MADWRGAGFGTDPDGDARRRAELEHARVDPEDLVPLPRAIGQLDTGDPLPLPGDLVAAGDPPEGLLDAPVTFDPHAVTRTPYPWGVAWQCACGRWEAVATGPSSAAYAGRDHARHVRDEQAPPGGL